MALQAAIISTSDLQQARLNRMQDANPRRAYGSRLSVIDFEAYFPSFPMASIFFFMISSCPCIFFVSAGLISPFAMC